MSSVKATILSQTMKAISSSSLWSRSPVLPSVRVRFLSMPLDASTFVASTPAATTGTRREGRGGSDLFWLQNVALVSFISTSSSRILKRVLRVMFSAPLVCFSLLDNNGTVRVTQYKTANIRTRTDWCYCRRKTVQVKSKETVGNSWNVLKVILGHKYHNH